MGEKDIKLEDESIRDKFAIEAMNAAILSYESVYWYNQVDKIARYSYMMAEAMMKERDKYK